MSFSSFSAGIFPSSRKHLGVIKLIRSILLWHVGLIKKIVFYPPSAHTEILI